MQVVFDQLSQPDWARLCAECAGAAGVPIQQDWAYGAAAQVLGRQVLRAAFLQAGQPVGCAQVLLASGRVFNRAVVSRGPLLREEKDAGGALAALRRALPLRTVLIATGDGGPRPRGTLDVITPRHLAVINLQGSVPDLRRALAGKWRNRLCAAERADLRIRRETGFDWLLDHEAEQQTQRGYAGLPPQFVRAWHGVAPDQLWVFVVRHKGRPCAGMIFMTHGSGATYQVGWTGDVGRRLGAHNVLMWHAMQCFQAQGLQRLELGTLDTENAPGLARFKLGTGAKVHTLGPTVMSFPGTGPRPAMAAKARWQGRPPEPQS